jgi:hypothetical protein
MGRYLLITTRFLDSVHRPGFHKQGNTTFWKLDLFPKRCVSLFMESRTMDKVQKPSSNECYTPSSEPFRRHLLLIVRTIRNIQIHSAGRISGFKQWYIYNNHLVIEGWYHEMCVCFVCVHVRMHVSTCMCTLWEGCYKKYTNKWTDHMSPLDIMHKSNGICDLSTQFYQIFFIFLQFWIAHGPFLFTEDRHLLSQSLSHYRYHFKQTIHYTDLPFVDDCDTTVF